MSPSCHKKRQNAGKHTQNGESKGVSTISKTPAGQLPETAEKQGRAQEFPQDSGTNIPFRKFAASLYPVCAHKRTAPHPARLRLSLHSLRRGTAEKQRRTTA